MSSIWVERPWHTARIIAKIHYLSSLRTPCAQAFRLSVLLHFDDDTQRRDGGILEHASQALTVERHEGKLAREGSSLVE